MELLEHRLCFAGSVSAEWVGETLRLTGDAQDNRIFIRRSASDPRFVEIVGQSDVGVEFNPINGLYRFLVDRARFNMEVDLGAGDDVFFVYGARGISGLTVVGGEGDDQIDIVASYLRGTVAVDAQGGTDSVRLRRTDVFGEVTLNGGANRDRFEIDSFRARSAFTLQDFSGASFIAIGTSSFDRFVQIATGSRQDELLLDSMTAKSDFVVGMRGETDRIKIRNSVFHGSPVVDAGGENDVVDRELLLSWDFGGGAQGWAAGFADYVDAHVPGQPSDSNLADYRLQSGIRPLPDEVKVSKTAYFLSGSNESDDLFMFLSRQLSSLDGVAANKDYHLSFNVRFASRVPAGLFGVGGPPAEAVFLKVGAIAVAPELVVQDNGLTVIGGLDKTGMTGRDMSIVGNIRNGDDPDAANSRQYKVVGRSHKHPLPIRSDNAGNLWPIVGTDSGFEGITSLYYTSISIRLTPVQ